MAMGSKRAFDLDFPNVQEARRKNVAERHARMNKKGWSHVVFSAVVSPSSMQTLARRFMPLSC